MKNNNANTMETWYEYDEKGNKIYEKSSIILPD